MRGRTRNFGHLKLLAIFLFVSVVVPNVLNAINTNAADNLGSFESGETGIKLCAQIDGGPEDSLRFLVTNDQGFSSDVIVANDTCQKIKAEAATYTIKQYLSQEYTLDSVSGGTVSADNTPFIATAAGQYSIIYSNEYTAKGYLHSFGYTATKQYATAVDVYFDANGGTGMMNAQRFGINSSQTLTANAFTRANHNFAGWNTKADGSGTSYTDEQSVAFATGGEITLYAQWRNTETLYRAITTRPNNGVDTNVNFGQKATVADGNGNGLNIVNGTENDQYPVYYFRGQVTDNNVIWGDYCWRVFRTTETGGTKMIYSGTPSLVQDGENTVKQCLSNGIISTEINGSMTNAIRYNNDQDSPADVGYMYGERVGYESLKAGSTEYTFSNNVSRNGNTYTLDTSTGQSITGTWADKHNIVAERYHYFCTDGTTSCDETKIAYNFYAYSSNTRYIYYFPIGGYDDIEDVKAAMFANEHDSVAKTAIEGWFEENSLDTHENDLEDTIFCNDRGLFSGALKDKDSSAADDSYFSGEARIHIRDLDGNVAPSLDCTDKRDSFTKTESATGNGKLGHRVGMITADEMTYGGMGWHSSDSSNYLWIGSSVFTMTPQTFMSGARAYLFAANTQLNQNPTMSSMGLRPVISISNPVVYEKGDGSSTNPYIVE